MRAQVDRFGPWIAEQRVVDRTDDAGLRDRASIDYRRGFDGARCRHGSNHGAGVTAASTGIELINIKTAGLPVLVQAHGEIEVRLALQPAGVRLNLRRVERFVVTI